MKTNKKILQTVLGVAGALTIGGCAFHPGDNIPGEVYGPPPADPETEVILQTEELETESETSEKVDLEEDFDVEANMNVCVYGPPEEDWEEP